MILTSAAWITVRGARAPLRWDGQCGFEAGGAALPPSAVASMGNRAGEDGCEERRDPASHDSAIQVATPKRGSTHFMSAR